MESASSAVAVKLQLALLKAVPPRLPLMLDPAAEYTNAAWPAGGAASRSHGAAVKPTSVWRNGWRMGKGAEMLLSSQIQRGCHALWTAQDAIIPPANPAAWPIQLTPGGLKNGRSAGSRPP